MNPEEAPMSDPKNPVTASTLKDACNLLRATVKEVERDLRAVKDKTAREQSGHEQAFPGQHGEVMANLTLAVRHLEDARMRLGKAIQYSQDGVSIYDKE
jgi:hypothetical protein